MLRSIFKLLYDYFMMILWHRKSCHKTILQHKDNQSINHNPLRPGVIGVPDRCLRCDGHPSMPVVCNAEQWWHRLAHPFLDVVFPWFMWSTCKNKHKDKIILWCFVNSPPWGLRQWQACNFSKVATQWQWWELNPQPFDWQGRTLSTEPWQPVEKSNAACIADCSFNYGLTLT